MKQSKMWSLWNHATVNETCWLNFWLFSLQAILVGDYILSVSSILLAQLRNEEVVKILSQVIEDLVRGKINVFSVCLNLVHEVNCGQWHKIELNANNREAPSSKQEHIVLYAQLRQIVVCYDARGLSAHLPAPCGSDKDSPHKTRIMKFDIP